MNGADIAVLVLDREVAETDAKPIGLWDVNGADGNEVG